MAPDECISFRQLRERKGAVGPAGVDDDEDFHAARGATVAQAAADGALFAERLAKVQQMTGLADPVYVEAFLQARSLGKGGGGLLLEGKRLVLEGWREGNAGFGAFRAP